MKRALAPTQFVKSIFSALFLAAALTLGGCSASTISGPDLAPDEATVQTGPGATHNEGANKDGEDEEEEQNQSGGGTSTTNTGGAPHNN